MVTMVAVTFFMMFMVFTMMAMVGSLEKVLKLKLQTSIIKSYVDGARLMGGGNVCGNRTHKGKNNDATESSELVNA